LKPYKKTVVAALLFVASLCKADGQETNSFSKQLQAKWATHDASNIVNFVVEQYQSDTNDPKRGFARGIIASFGQHWCRGGSNFIMRAHDLLASSTNYPSVTKKDITRQMKLLAIEFGIMAKGITKEPFDSGPVVNTNDLAVLFVAWPSNIPYCEIIQKLDCNSKGEIRIPVNGCVNQ